MENISFIYNSKKVIADTRKILVISRTFFPKEGGIEEYVYNRCLQEPENIILLAANYPGDKEFDAKQNFPIYRWYIPTHIPNGLIGGVIKQLLCIFWSFILPIKLYFRYRYRLIEWGHGYDFPSILLLSYLLPIRFFIYLHGNDILCPLKNPLLRSLFQLTLQRATGIVCNSSFTRDYLSSHIKFDTPTHIINPNVRPEKFGLGIYNQATINNLGQRIRQQFNIPESAVVILSVGRLVKRKGFDRVIENLPALVAEGLDVHYIICGRGAMESELKRLAQSLQVKERVHFAGFVPDSELAAYYTACDIFAMLTFFDSKAASIEGFGIVYAEAGYFGKPVIASQVGGVVDAVHHGENGILIDPNSSSEALAGLKHLCKDSELRQKLGSKGRELAQRKTQWQVLSTEF